MKKPKFNIIDILIVLLIVAVALAGVYVLRSKTDTQTNTALAEVLLTIEEKDINDTQREYYLERAEAGDSIIVGIKEKVTGTLEKIEISPAKFIYDNPITGEKEYKDEIGKYNVYFTIRAEIAETDKDFLIGTDKVKVGKDMNCIGKGYSGYGTVVDIKKAEVINND